MNFYKDLSSTRLPIKEVLADERHFHTLPPDWHVIITDIKNSTQAVNAGRNDDVNLVAAGSLIAAINAVKQYNTEIPFFFGGDGGTVIVPGELLQNLLSGLNAHKTNSLKNFMLELRIGCISISEINRNGHEIKIAKIEIANGFSKPLVIGDGLKYAEQKIKSTYKPDETVASDIGTNLNLEGLECRWDRIKPPAARLEVVCLLVEAVHQQNQLEVYRDVMNKMDEIYGETSKRHPLSVKNLKLLLSWNKLRKEMIARYGKWKQGYYIRIFFQTLLGKLLFSYQQKIGNLNDKSYLAQLIMFSDTLTIDGRVNTIITGTKENRIRLLDYLKEQEEKGLLIYGHHVSPESIMTCYIENRNSKHIHFLDGSNGGYTEASKELKPKIRAVAAI